jgi:hypothetical protein
VDGAVVFEPDPWTGNLDTDTQKQPKRVDECGEWLKKRLAAGCRLSNTLLQEAEAEGFTRDLCYRAKKQLGIRATRTGFGDGRWYWQLKKDEA